jgi:hypothetical protein
MKYLALFSVLFLAGCATCKPDIVIQKVEVPVSVPCVKQAVQKPSFPLQGTNPNEDIFVLTKRALAEIELRRGYEGELEAVIQGCTSVTPAPK